MKHLARFFLLALFSMAFANFALAEIASDLPKRLQAEIDEFKKDLETLRGEALIGAADRLTGSGISNPALYKIVEAKTKTLITEHDTNPKNDVIANELNAVIRALGSMSPNAHDIIHGLVETAHSRGIRNRAVRLYPKLPWFEKRNKIMQNPDSYQPGQDLMTYRYLNLLSSDDYSIGRWGLEELDRRRGAEAPVYVKMREILARDKSNIKDETHLDYLAWICKLLGRYDAANSTELLKSIQDDPQDNKFFKKLKKYAKVK
jgi:hypothetical protein